MRGGDNRSRETRVNERIRAREVRVIDEEGQMLGIMSVPAALALARERNLDLVEVSPMASPPVCKILDWGRYKYEQSKRESEARRHQKVTALREIRMRPRTDEHDVQVKVRKIQQFLAEGDKVKVSVTFRGREMAHPELGRVLLDQVTQELKGLGNIERAPIMEGRMMSMIVSRGAGMETVKRTPPAGPQDSPPGQQPAPAPRSGGTAGASGATASGGNGSKEPFAPPAPGSSSSTSPSAPSAQ